MVSNVPKNEIMTSEGHHINWSAPRTYTCTYDRAFCYRGFYDQNKFRRETISWAPISNSRTRLACTNAHITPPPSPYVWHARRQRFKFRNKRYGDDELRYGDRRSIRSTRRSPFDRYAALKMWGVGLSFEIWGWYSALSESRAPKR